MNGAFLLAQGQGTHSHGETHGAKPRNQREKFLGTLAIRRFSYFKISNQARRHQSVGCQTIRGYIPGQAGS